MVEIPSSPKHLGRRAALLTVVGLAGLMAGVGLSARYSKTFRRDLQRLSRILFAELKRDAVRTRRVGKALADEITRDIIKPIRAGKKLSQADLERIAHQLRLRWEAALAKGKQLKKRGK